MTNGPLSALRMRYSRLRRQQLDEARALKEDEENAANLEREQQQAGRRPGPQAQGPEVPSR
jgi:hypothetical protein